MPTGAHSAGVNYMVTPSGGWTAYNDCVYDPTTGQYTVPNVTYYDIGSGHLHLDSGLLVNFATGASTGVTATLTQSGGVGWQPSASGGGSDTLSGTDAFITFHNIVDMQGVIYYGDPGWYVDLTFTGLDPAKTYTFATSANRNGGSTYAGRFTRFTLSDVVAATNASTPGVTIINPLSIAFSTGDNYTSGYVARWTGIQPGADGGFTVRAQADSLSITQAYAFSVFMLKEEPSAP